MQRKTLWNRLLSFALIASTLAIVGQNAIAQTARYSGYYRVAFQDATPPTLQSAPVPAPIEMNAVPDAAPIGIPEQPGGNSIWRDRSYAAMPCGAPPLGMSEPLFSGVGHCLDRYDTLWSGYCSECKAPALMIALDKLHGVCNRCAAPCPSNCSTCEQCSGSACAAPLQEEVITPEAEVEVDLVHPAPEIAVPETGAPE